MQKIARAIFPAALLVSAGALAQPARPPVAPPPAPAASASASAIAPVDLPASPTVADPLLEPVPPAAKTVSGWQDALALVRARSTDFRIALGDLERAHAQARVALAGALPTLTGSANVTDSLVRTTVAPLSGEPDVQMFPPRALTYGASATLTIPVFAPRAWYARGTAKRGEQTAETALAEQKRVLAAGVASALVSVITAERVAELNRSGLRASLERLSLTKRRSDLGAATALDVLRVEQDANQARAAIVSGDESLRKAREALGVALGFTEAYGAPRDLDLDAFARDSERACPRGGSAETRTDVVLSQERIELAKRGVRDVELAFWPTVNVVTTYSATVTPYFASLPTGEVDRKNTLHTWTIAGVLSWNIFDGGTRYGNLQDTRAQVDQAEARAEATKRAAVLQVVQATRSVSVAEEARKVAERSRDLAKEAERLARVGFQLGRGTSLELVDAGRSLREAEIQLALKEFDTIEAKIQALLALSTCTY